MQEGLQTDPLEYTQTWPICSLWFKCDHRRDFEVHSQASNCLSITQIPGLFHLHQVVYTDHNEFPLKAPKQELTLFTVKIFQLAQSSTLRQHRGLGEQPHHCHHLLSSESHQDLTRLRLCLALNQQQQVEIVILGRASPFHIRCQSQWLLPSFPPNHFPSKSAARACFTGHFIWSTM